MDILTSDINTEGVHQRGIWLGRENLGILGFDGL